MPSVRSVGLGILLLTAGCAGVGLAPPREPAGPGVAQDAPVAVSPTEATTRQDESAAKKPPEAQAAQVESVAVKPEAPQAAPPVADSSGTSRNGASAPAAEPPAQARATPAPTGPAQKATSKAAVPEKPPAPPPLDLTSLEKRLRETDAIGVFTKLTLKNQVDDLLDRFQAHYEGRAKSTVPELRQPFDLLILKVLSLLQDRDSSLAGAILASREAMWGILADPVKFQKLVVQNRG